MDLLRPNNCTVCGANLNMVGRSHRCVPVSRGGSKDPTPRPVEEPANQCRSSSTAKWGRSDPTDTGPRETFDRKTYQRNYMRDYMRARRGSKLNVPKSS